jgi:hypothetical protein
MIPDEQIDLVAKAMVADLHAQPDEVQGAFRYLYAQVAYQEHLFDLIGREITRRSRSAGGKTPSGST